MAFAVYKVEKWKTHEGKIRVETLVRIEETKEEAVERCLGDGVVRELPGEVEPTRMCDCESPMYYEHGRGVGGQRYLRCYTCRASREEGT